jgi:hypothetical protein
VGIEILTPAEREAALRSDTEWVRALSDTLHDAKYARILHFLSNQTFDPAKWPEGATPEDIAAFVGFNGETVLSRIVDMAMRNVLLSDYAYNPTDILYCFTAIPTVNGFCLKSPNLGIPVVVLNHGLAGYISDAAHLTLGLTGWADATYCSHYPADVIMQGLFELAEGVGAEKPALLLKIEAIRCADKHSRDPFRMLHEVMCWVAELFIVLHELGHIALGHLDPADVTYAFEEEIGSTAPVFNRSQLQEFAADRFAFDRLIEIAVKPDGPQRKDIGYAIGCLMILMRTVETVSSNSASDTHPSAAFRWERLRAEVGNLQGPAALDSIDYFFEWINRFDQGKRT